MLPLVVGIFDFHLPALILAQIRSDHPDVAIWTLGRSKLIQYRPP